ncbi:hypothetical protein PFISCL1PPCAC_28906 [Pristionchus fissidentatus]|uniref:7TM GPCR serpentine receptor class x (Srx) domain-containing protein n=1 Tax=Pristionchus fissidentatus TaxID=1538716 RepID=A0AAV5X0J6_9BILA|nr:hypothetical protein PFISCL1PPCAC_28906 [Pristionchus fissidentatus]
MICDIVKIGLTTAYSVIPDVHAPATDSRFSITLTVTCEIFYFSSCLMHVLFAIHRLIFIVFPKKKLTWESYTWLAMAICVALAVLKAFLTQMMHKDLYLMYDRVIMCWLFTKTSKTELYKNIKMGLSYAEVIIVFALDSISFGKLLHLKSRISSAIWDANTRAEAKLVVQSLLQNIPTLTLVFFYFHVLPTQTDAFHMFLCSLTWNISSGMDG